MGGKYCVEICGRTGMQCIWCSYDACPDRRVEWRASQWQGTPRLAEGDVDDHETKGGAEPNSNPYYDVISRTIG